jgi:hypothetical protein
LIVVDMDARGYGIAPRFGTHDVETVAHIHVGVRIFP